MKCMRANNQVQRTPMIPHFNPELLSPIGVNLIHGLPSGRVKKHRKFAKASIFAYIQAEKHLY